MKPITFITGNLHKLKQVQTYLTYPMEHIKLDLTEIQSTDPLEVARHKAEEAYKQLGKPVLVEDTSLTFHALGKLPGTFIKHFLDEIGNEKMCRMLDPFDDRSATAWIIFTYHDGENIHIFDWKQPGRITKNPRGEGFGWNPIFMPEGYDQTFAEMNEPTIKEIAMRRRALEKFEVYLQQHES